MKRICVVTSTRADYGLLRWVMTEIQSSVELGLQLIVTGAHLAPRFGLTYREIELDGFVIDRKIDMRLDSDTPVGILKSMANALPRFAEAFDELKPDIVVLLGDRYELLAVASAATISRVPIAHLHGGELTEGAYDDAIRHAITKMSHLHFVAAEPYRERVLQMGEQPENVFNVGGLGIDGLNKIDLMGRAELERSLEFSFGFRNLLVTFHPVTLEPGMAQRQIDELLKALADLEKTHLIFTMPNADSESAVLFEMISAYVIRHKETARAYTSLGHQRYLSCVAHVDGVVGNSSSGLLEVPSLKKGTVNIGDRQKGRLKAKSVIDCLPQRDSIRRAIGRLYQQDFLSLLQNVKNPYGTGGASEKIVQVLRGYDFGKLLRKRFHDIS